ncbi:hypothetical protein IMZ31_20665 (plasmid) [Pontibacillus sp. ALD_SL1]|uniref:hypothetical protein n=1 Tax=Pontibacillus sp. ALD_SL1 TaxID=2777185 RepID=UPI001A97AC69|nr:hypothetical protein [Pontibacillus sp. ALD_SL1]QST02962.1 hypothetical protein IMZ31_20665 [Pontibacillus sp. ALD_SL1]
MKFINENGTLTLKKERPALQPKRVAKTGVILFTIALFWASLGMFGMEQLVFWGFEALEHIGLGPYFEPLFKTVGHVVSV